MDKVNKTNNKLMAIKNIMSKLTKLGSAIGLIKAVMPRTKRILNIFDPIIFPIARSTFFLNIAVKDTTNSGRELPSAITVAEIKKLLIKIQC